MNDPLWVALPVLAIAGIATWADVRTRKIPNLLTFPALLAGVIFHSFTGGLDGAKDALIGALVAGGILFPGWLMGFMGAGDVKLMGAIGAWLGFPLALFATLFAFIANGVIVVVVALHRGVFKDSLQRAGMLGFHLMARTGLAGKLPNSGLRFPFGPAVLIGAAFALWRAL